MDLILLKVLFTASETTSLLSPFVRNALRRVLLTDLDPLEPNRVFVGSEHDDVIVA